MATTAGIVTPFPHTCRASIIPPELIARKSAKVQIQDRDGAKVACTRARRKLPRLRLLWADGAYAGKLVDWIYDTCHWLLTIIKRPDTAKGFVLLPHRWVVERTFAWFGNYRRLSKDYEYLPATSEAMIYLAMAHLMVRRLARK